MTHSLSWLMLLLTVTLGNLILGFCIATILGHGPKWASEGFAHIGGLPALFKKKPVTAAATHDAAGHASH